MTYWPVRRFLHPLDRQRFMWPIPRARVFEDRATGTLYLLSHDVNTDTVTLTTPVPARANAVPEEPILVAPLGRIRLFVRNGALRYEEFSPWDLPTGNPPFVGNVATRGEPVFTLNFTGLRTTYELSADVVEAFGDPLCLKRYDNLGRTLAITDLGCTLFLEAGEAVFEEGVFEVGVFT